MALRLLLLFLSFLAVFSGFFGSLWKVFWGAFGGGGFWGRSWVVFGASLGAFGPPSACLWVPFGGLWAALAEALGEGERELRATKNKNRPSWWLFFGRGKGGGIYVS